MSWATLSAHTNRVAFARMGGVSATAGAVTGQGFFSLSGEYMHGERVISDVPMFTTERATFGSLGYGDPITINGTAWLCQEKPLALADGNLCVILLSPAPPPPPPPAGANYLTTVLGVPLTSVLGVPLEVLP